MFEIDIILLNVDDTEENVMADGGVTEKMGLTTNKVAALDIMEATVLLKAARYCVPFCCSWTGPTVKLVDVAP